MNIFEWNIIKLLVKNTFAMYARDRRAWNVLYRPGSYTSCARYPNIIKLCARNNNIIRTTHYYYHPVPTFAASGYTYTHDRTVLRMKIINCVNIERAYVCYTCILRARIFHERRSSRMIYICVQQNVYVLASGSIYYCTLYNYYLYIIYVHVYTMIIWPCVCVQ